MIGQLLKDRYEIYQELGGGGLATVYLARDIKTSEIYAVKVLRGYMTEDPETLARFEREARLMSELNDPHFVRVFDYGKHGDQPFMVMEFVEGDTLKIMILEKGRLPVGQALSIARQVACGLATIHRHEVIHRDIKPQNIMVRPDGKIKIMDFGIAKAMNMSTLTRTGFMVGTPHYISPEQAVGNPTDHRTDFYSLGVVLYEMLTGRLPFSGKTPIAILLKHVNEPVPEGWAGDCGAHPDVAALVNRCLAKSPDDRYANAKALVRAIDVLARAQHLDVGESKPARQSKPAHEPKPATKPAATPSAATAPSYSDPTIVAPVASADATMVWHGNPATRKTSKGGVRWRTAVIRQLLAAAFDDPSLDSLCREHFPEVYRHVVPMTSTLLRIQALIDYCMQNDEMDRLIALAQQRNPTEYERFAPKLKR